MEFIKFIFQDGRHWLGAVIILLIIMSPLIIYAEGKSTHYYDDEE